MVERIPKPLAHNIDETCPVAHEIMWNDPASREEINEQRKLMRVHEDGNFFENFKRGTGYLYTGEAVEDFLNANALTNVIRGHEMIMSGYKFHYDGKCVTIFSCSGYVGENNTSAAVFIDNEKMKIVQINTPEMVVKEN